MFPTRTANLLAQLKARGFYPTVEPPTLSKFGGSVPEGYQLTFSAGTGTIYYTVDGSDPRLPGGGVSPTATATSISQSTVVPTGSQWRVWDQNNQPSNWNSRTFDDATWATATAPLGYGNAGEVANVATGGTIRNSAAYFRKTFTVSNPATITGLSIGLARDDGAVVYLNGTEVVRSNMPTGVISHTTWASTTVSSNAKLTVATFNVPANLLVAGTNVLAVEVHQINASSSDLRLELSLTATSSPGVTLDQNKIVKARLLNAGTWSALADATFQVAHPLLSGGPYVFSEWAGTAAASRYPKAMRLYQTDVLDPGLTAEMTSPWTLPYNLTSRSRINGLGSDGLAFLNTGSVQTTPGAGFVGAAVVALDTTGTQDIRVTWKGGTMVPNERDYGIRLQYRVGDSGTFVDVLGPGDVPVEYLRNVAAGHTQVIGPVSLPVAAENQPLVELRWKYYFRSGITGSRPQLRLDDIQITAGPVMPETLALLEFPATAQVGALSGPVSVQVLGRNGALAADFNGPVTVGLVGSGGLLSGTLTRQAVAGRVTFDDLVFQQPGSHTLTVTSDGLAAATSIIPTQVIGLTELVMPRIVQGEQPENNQRVPFACLLKLDGLLPNATYRFANQFVNDEDSATQEGAGNMVFTGPAFIRSTESPRFLTGDLHVRHGEFVADGSGSYSGWFVTEPTSNARFTPGATVRVRLLLNDGLAGEMTAHYLTASGPVTVTAFGSGPGDGSAVYGESAAAARNFMVLYEEAAGTSRPLAATSVEATGMVADLRYAPFYQTNVIGQTGRWGTLIPNLLSNGVMRFEERSLATGEVVAVFASPTGNRPTTGLAMGSTPVGLWLPGTDASGFDRWLASRYPLPELRDPAVGGASSDRDNDGTINLLEYAFGMDPDQSSTAGLPNAVVESVAGVSQLVFRYRRLIGDSGMNYAVETSPDMLLWEDAAGAWLSPPEAQPNADGITETVTCRMGVEISHPLRFCRVRVVEP
jgi:hypothetical protein